MPAIPPEALDALAAALPGQVLPGSGGHRYPLREMLGEGGQGWVFRATWNGSVGVVVKVLRPDAATPDALARFQREAQVLRALSQQPVPNPHLVRFFDHAYASVRVAATGQLWELPFTVLELVEGLTLADAIAASPSSGVGLERARRILRHAVFALKDVHAHNVVHRDLKPSNILLAGTGSQEIAKVTDFGLAKMLDAGLHRTTGLAGATMGYAPPEQFEEGNIRVGPPTDVFSLAAIVYEMVSGVAAFPVPPGASPIVVLSRILVDAPPSLARVMNRLPVELRERPDVVATLDTELARALSPRPAERHPTVTAFHGAIEGALSSLHATPSLSLGAPAALSVKPSERPPAVSTRPGLGGARTVPLGDEGIPQSAYRIEGASPPQRDSLPIGAETVPQLRWFPRSPALAPQSFLGIAVAPQGDAAVGCGVHGTARWDGRAWSTLDVPSGFDARAARASVWLGGTVFLAGASPTVVAIGEDRSVGVWRFEGSGFTFLSMAADAHGLVLAGQRTEGGQSIGIVAEVPFAQLPGQKARVRDVPGTTCVRAAVRVGAGILACGDGGTLAFLPEGATPNVVRVCDATLNAILRVGEAVALVVGGGGFVFQVSSQLDYHLEAIQTTKNLHAITRAPDGTPWCAGDEQRVLKRNPSGWVRAGSLPGPGRILALHAGTRSVLGFADDGGVVEGTG